MAQRLITPEQLAEIESLELRARTIVESVLTGTHRGNDRGFSIDFAEHRDYSPGDDIRFLDWKLYGRRDRFYVRQFEDENQLQAWVLLDDSGSMRYRSENSPLSKLEYAGSLAAALVWIASSQRDLAGLSLTESARSLGPVTGLAGIQRVVDEIENAFNHQELPNSTPDDDDWRQLLACTEKIPARSVVILLTDAFGDLRSLERVLSLLQRKKCDVRLGQILDPAEQTFPFEGNVVFRDLEGAGEQLTMTNAVRNAYLAELRNFQLELKRTCGTRQTQYTLIQTNEPMDTSLRRLLSSGSTR